MDVKKFKTRNLKILSFFNYGMVVKKFKTLQPEDFIIFLLRTGYEEI